MKAAMFIVLGLVFVTSQAIAGTVLFTPSTLSLEAGQTAEVQVTVTTDEIGSFDALSMTVGSDDLALTQFTYAQAFSDALSFSFAPRTAGFYESDWLVLGVLADAVDTTVVGVVTIDTTGLYAGDYTIRVDPTVDGTSELARGVLTETLSGTLTVSVSGEAAPEDPDPDPDDTPGDGGGDTGGDDGSDTTSPDDDDDAKPTDDPEDPKDPNGDKDDGDDKDDGTDGDDGGDTIVDDGDTQKDPDEGQDDTNGNDSGDDIGIDDSGEDQVNDNSGDNQTNDDDGTDVETDGADDAGDGSGTDDTNAEDDANQNDNTSGTTASRGFCGAGMLVAMLGLTLALGGSRLLRRR